MAFLASPNAQRAHNLPALQASVQPFQQQAIQQQQQQQQSQGGKIPGYERASTLNPQQEQLFSQLVKMLTSGQGPLGSIFGQGQEADDQFSAPYLRQFNEQTIPGIANRFAGTGAGGLSRSAFQNALGQSGAALQENLANLRGGLQMQGLSQLQQLLGINTQALLPTPKPWWQEALIGASGGLGQGVGSALTHAATGGIGGYGQLASAVASQIKKP